jgi:hypothetical protein
MEKSFIINNENEVVFTIGRMNPPTPGHKKLIKQMMIYALTNNLSQINIILSSTIDDKKNPLEIEEKRMLVYVIFNTIKKELISERKFDENKIMNMNAEIVGMNEEDDISLEHNKILSKIKYFLQYIYGYPRPYLLMTLFIGEDRAKDYIWIGEWLKSLNPSVNFKIESLPRSDTDMSATYIRGLVLNGSEESKQLFIKYMKDLGIDNFDIENIYMQIQSNIKNKKGGKKTRKYRKSIRKSRKSIRKSRKYRKYRKSRKSRKSITK